MSDTQAQEVSKSIIAVLSPALQISSLGKLIYVEVKTDKAIAVGNEISRSVTMLTACPKQNEPPSKGHPIQWINRTSRITLSRTRREDTTGPDVCPL